MDNRKLLLLGLIKQHEMHGYKLMDFIDKNLSTCTNLKKSTAYYLLDKMSQDGWIQFREDTSGNRPPRRVYQITKEGERAFRDLLKEQLSAYDTTYFEGDSALLFLDEFSMDEQKDFLSKRLQQLNEILSLTIAIPKHEGKTELLINHQLHHLKSEKDWLEKLIKDQIN